MASGRRASMREGPLAQLFRNTDEEEARPAQGSPEGGVEEREPERPRAAEPRREAAGRARPEPPHGFERRATEAARRAQERAERRREREQRWGGTEGPPTPEERLRAVCSADIPENILDR